MKESNIAPWARQLFVSILGTAIGLGLTVTVDRAMENNKSQRAQRETAIMAVCDIDEICRNIKDEMHWEDTLHNVTMYVSTHLEKIESMSEDSLNMVFRYLYDDPSEMKMWAIDTKENVFNSGMEARKSLDSNKFYDNVQSCYYVRRALMKTMETSLFFRRPLESESYEAFLQTLGPNDMSDDGNPALPSKRLLIKKVFENSSTSLYIRRYLFRKRAYMQTLQELTNLNRENKQLMDITNQDIEEYIRQNVNTSQAATTELIVGSWEETLADYTRIYDFCADSTAVTTLTMQMSTRLVLKEEQMEVVTSLPMTLRLKGRWALKADSLTTLYDGQSVELLTFDLDTSQLPESALERMKDSLDIKKQEFKEMVLNWFKTEAYKPLNKTYAVSFDRIGSTMILSSQETGPTGEKETVTIRLYRKE